MKRTAYIGFILGLAAITALVVWQGAGEVGRALAELGAGVLLFLPVYAVFLAVGAVSWRLLFEPGHAPGFGPAWLAIWIGPSINTLLPVGTLGGEVVKARVLTHYGIGAHQAGGSVVADTTVQALSLVLWGMIGAAVLAWVSADGKLGAITLGAMLVFGAGVVTFLLLQRAGALGGIARTVGRWTGRDSSKAVAVLVEFDGHLRQIYQRPGRVFWATAIRLASRVVMVTEVWLAAALMGHPISPWEALMIRSLSSAVRGAAFFVPNGLGVQEGAYMMLGAVIGLPPGFSLSMSLAVRARELIASVPGLLAWQHIEGRKLRQLLADTKGEGDGG